MRAKKKKTNRPRRKPHESKLATPAANGKPRGFREVETEWMNSHPEELRKCAGEYVIVEGTEIIAHGKEPAELFEIAERRGIQIPYIFFVEPPLPPNTYRIG
jgi:hypothetical protein